MEDLKMKVLRVLCIVFLILSLLATGLMAAIKAGIGMELDSIKDLKESDTKTKIGTEVKFKDGEPYFYLEENGKKKEYTEKKYTESMETIKDAFGTGVYVCGGFCVIMVAGIVVTSVVISKKNKDE